jgi:hypothetical protein
MISRPAPAGTARMRTVAVSGVATTTTVRISVEART